MRHRFLAVAILAAALTAALVGFGQTNLTAFAKTLTTTTTASSTGSCQYGTDQYGTCLPPPPSGCQYGTDQYSGCLPPPPPPSGCEYGSDQYGACLPPPPPNCQYGTDQYGVCLAPPTLEWPQSLTPPEISGDVSAIGNTLTVSNGTWSGSPTAFTYQWYRADSSFNWVEIDGATANTHTLTAADAGDWIGVFVIATNSYGSSWAWASVGWQAGVPHVLTWPQISGDLSQVGDLVRVSDGTWSSTSAITIGYQWNRCDPATYACTSIDGATSNSYTLTDADVGYLIEADVTATNSNGSFTASAGAQWPVGAPEVLLYPQISGDEMAAGDTLTVSRGTWSGSPSIAYQWYRCDPDTFACAAIGGATSNAYTITATDLGYLLRADVIATNANGSSTASAWTQTIGAPELVGNYPQISGDETAAGNTLTVGTGTWRGSPAITYQWNRCRDYSSCDPIPGATSASYTTSASDLGHYLQVTLTATNGNGSTTLSASTQWRIGAPEIADSYAYPQISGDETEAENALTVSSGTWTGSPTLGYQWNRCSDFSSCDPIPGATSAGYKTSSADLGDYLQVAVTATNANGSSSVSAWTQWKIGAPEIMNYDYPQISGDETAAGGTLTVSDGTWSGAPTLSYQWSRCDQSAGCTQIPGATSTDYSTVSADLGHHLQAEVTATNANGSTTEYTGWTQWAIGAPELLSYPQIDGDPGTVGNTLTVIHGGWTGSPTISYQWKRCDTTSFQCAAISGATSDTYTLTVADVGYWVEAEVTATNAYGASSATATAYTTTGDRPVLNDVPSDITAPATGPDGAAVTYTAPTATDPVDGDVPVTCDPASGTTFPFGTSTVTCTATNSLGFSSSATFTVTVTDAAPTFDATPDISVEATGSDGAQVIFSVSATDSDDGVATIGCTPSSGSVFPLGDTSVDCIATDYHGLTAEATFTVHVVDTTPPQITDVPTVPTTRTTNPAGATIMYTAPTATDLVDGSVTVTCNPTSGATFPIGTTTVTCSATDAAGNTSTASFDVTVKLNHPPTANLALTATSGIAPLTTTATIGGTDSDGDPLNYTLDFGDGTDPLTGDLPHDPIQHDYQQPGNYTATLTVSDGIATDATQQTVTVTQDQPPQFGTTPDITKEATGPDGAHVNYTVDATDPDDGVASTACSPASGSLFPLGDTSVTCTATDHHGLTAQAAFTVHVVDTTPPQFTNVPDPAPVSTADPTGAPVDYTPPTATDIVDGQVPVTCDPAPKATFRAGTTTVTCTAADTTGNTATATFDVIVKLNHPPTATLTLTSASGTAPLDTTATLAANDVDGDPLNYTLDFGDGSDALTGSLPAAAIQHSYQQAGTYTAELQVTDGIATTISAVTVVVAAPEPLAANAGDDTVASVGDPVAFDGSASRPLAGIDEYTWDFGDGSPTADGVHVSHVYTTAGTYTATLTVRRGTETSTDTIAINVAPPAATGLDVTVQATGGGSLADADVTVIDAGGTRYSAVTDTSGVAHLSGLADGTYTVYAWLNGYLPNTTQASVTNGSGTATVALDSGSVGGTTLTADRLDRQQIVDAGINPDDPANQNVYQFEVHLNFSSQTLTFSGYTTGNGFVDPTFSGGDAGGGGGGGGDCTCASIGGYVAYPSVHYTGDQPTIVWLIIPGEAKWLKEFFDVKLVVSNLASPAFTFDHGEASLAQLPDGLSLAPTPTPQKLVQNVPDIPGQQSAEVDWLVRGDAEGYYSLSANYTGTLEPLAAPVSFSASTTSGALHVWGGSALQMIIDADDSATPDYPYHVRVGLKNVADVPVYNASVTLKKDGKAGYIYQPQERLQQGTDTIQPGTTFWANYILVPQTSGPLNLAKSFVAQTGGNASLATTITSHPAPLPGSVPDAHTVGMKGKVAVFFKPVDGGADYRIFTTADRSTDFADQPADFYMAPDRDGWKVAVVRNVPLGTNEWFAVSSIIGGRPTMVHPLIDGSSAVDSAAAAVDVSIDDPTNSVHTCGQTSVAVHLRVSDPVFPLKSLSIKENGVSKTLTVQQVSAYYWTADMTLDLSNGAVELIAQGTNADPDTADAAGVAFDQTFDTTCVRQRAVVVAMGLFSSLSDSPGSNDVPNLHPTCDDSGARQFPDGVDGFDEQAATNACDADGVANGNLVSYLESKGYSPGASRQAGGRTLLEFSYKGADVTCGGSDGPTFVPRAYSSGDTQKELLKLGDYSTATADDYVDALKQYSDCWAQQYHEALTFTVIGHSEGGYEALAIARSAASKGYKGLISSAVSVDGAIQPMMVAKELNFGGCLVTSGFWHLPADVGGWLWQAGQLPTDWGEHHFDAEDVASEIRRVQAFGTRVATVTNGDDPCLYNDATLNKAADDTRSWDINYGKGSEEHGAALNAHGDEVNRTGFPLTDFLTSQGYVEPADSPDVTQPPLVRQLSTVQRTRASSSTATEGLVGRLVDPSTGDPVTGGIAAFGPDGLHLISTRSDGSFELPLGDGDYTVYADPQDDGETGAWVGGTSHATAAVFHVTAQLGMTDIGSISGRNLPILTVHLTTDGGPPVDGGAALVDGTGHEVAFGLADKTGVVRLAAEAGSYQLVAGAADTTSLTRAIKLDVDSNATVDLAPAGSVRATFLDAAGNPVPWVAAAIYSSGTLVGAGLTDSHGGFTFSGLSDGLYTVKLFEGLDRFVLPDITLATRAAAGASTSTTYQLGVGSPPVFTADNPPTELVLGSTYAFTFAAGGSPAPAFSIASGELPDGLSFEPSGTLTGTPTKAGAFTFTVRASNSAGEVTAGPFTLVATSPDTTAPTTTATLSPTPNIDGWVHAPVVVTLRADDGPGGSGVHGLTYSATGAQVLTSTTVSSSSVMLPAITAEGETTISFHSVDNAGNVEPQQTLVVRVDTTPPTIGGARTPEPNSSGWNNSDVTVTFTCADDGSGVASCPAATTVGEGSAQKVTGTATDDAGNQASASIDGINVDETPPTLTGTPTTEPNPSGWYGGDVTIRWACSDALSGVDQNCPADDVLAGEGKAVTASASVSDLAGNVSAATSQPVNIDRTPPMTTASAPDGWTNTDVMVALSASDNLSGVAATYYELDGAAATSGTTIDISSEGMHTLVYWSVDKAGNSERKHTVKVLIDKTAPTITHRLVPVPNAAGWNNSDVTVSFDCADALSGIAFCSLDQLVIEEGQALQVSGDARDNAGNQAHDTAEVSLDKTPPTITASPDRAANGDGWYNADVVVSFTCNDALSGITACPTTMTLSEGEGQKASGSAVDAAGNQSTASLNGINVDETPPVITYTGNAGSYTVDQTVAIDCTAADALSGIASDTCSDASGPAYTFGVGSHELSASATDKADNTTTASATFTVQVTLDSLCRLTQQFVESSPRYQALPARRRKQGDEIVTRLCDHLTAAQRTLPLQARALLLRAYEVEVTALARSGWLTKSQAQTLDRLADVLQPQEKPKPPEPGRSRHDDASPKRGHGQQPGRFRRRLASGPFPRRV